MSTITISSLHYYPIKSCGGWSVDSAEITPTGFANDRLLMLVHENGTFMTQRTYPQMALITPQLRGESLTLSAPNMPTMTVTTRSDGPTRNVVVWRDTCAAIDQGDAVAQWLSDFLGRPSRLVAMAKDHQRHVNPEWAVNKTDVVSFADGYPILMISEESLALLNSKLEIALPMNRFRPNIVVKGTQAHFEDNWHRFRIGDIDMASIKPCVRCAVTTTDQSTAQRGKEPLKTLATYRQNENGVIFGANVIALKLGSIRVGDTLTVTQQKP